MTRLASFMFGRWVAIALLACLGVCSAKADTIVCGANCTDNGTSFTWTGIVVTGHESSYEWAPTQSTDSVTLWYGGSGTEAVAITDCTANCGTVDSISNPDGNNAAYALLFAPGPGGIIDFVIDSAGATTLGPPPSNISCADYGAQCNFFDYTASSVCWGDLCNSGPGSGTIKDFTLLSVGSGDFEVQANSASLTFSLPEQGPSAEDDPPPAFTPEPSSLLMLGTGLLGLLWFGRRALA